MMIPLLLNEVNVKWGLELMRINTKNILLHTITTLILVAISVIAYLMLAWFEKSSQRDLNRFLETALKSAHQGELRLYQRYYTRTLLLSNDERLREATKRLIHTPNVMV
jgi:hypothetical protein